MSLARDIADLGSSATSLDTVGSNLVINGAMEVAQRGTSSTANGYGSVDRFTTLCSGTDEAPTQAQVDVASGTTPYTLGFRKALKITNGNQTSGAGAADYLAIYHRIEGQDISSSGWNTTDSNSKLTLSYWVKSSVAQTFYGRFRAFASSQYEYTYSFALSANTWTKVTKTIPGNSNFSSLVNTNAEGFFHVWQCFFGTDYTNNKTLDEWAVKDNANKSPDMTSTWYTTNDATFEITGVQLQAGEATDFEHRSYGDELQRCSRYFQKIEVLGSAGSFSPFPYTGLSRTSTIGKITCGWTTPLRTAPTITTTDANTFAIPNGTGSSIAVDSISMGRINALAAFIEFTVASGLTVGQATYLNTNNTADPSISADAEL